MAHGQRWGKAEPAQSPGLSLSETNILSLTPRCPLDATGREGPISLILILQVFRIVFVPFAAFSFGYKKQHVAENTEKLIPLGPSFFLNMYIKK